MTSRSKLMTSRRCRLVRASSEIGMQNQQPQQHLSIHGSGGRSLCQTAWLIDSPSEKSSVVRYSSEAVQCIKGTHSAKHRLLGFRTAAVSPTLSTSAVSVSLISYGPQLQDTTTSNVLTSLQPHYDDVTLVNFCKTSDNKWKTPTISSIGEWSTTEKRVRINVSGHHFETQLDVLNKHPDTLLGNRARRSRFYDRTRNEFFFDRHRPSFEAIFTYYQRGGRLRRPLHVPDEVFLDELVFYELETDIVDEYKRSEGYTTEKMTWPSNKIMKCLWMLFECPETSRPAFCIAVWSVLVTLVSIVLFCVETLPSFATTHCEADEAPNFLDAFFITETVCTAWFTLEALVRFIACPSKLDFWRDFKNIVDVVAIVPYYVTLFNVLSTMSCSGAKSSASLAFLRVIRLIRVFKLTKHSVGLQVLLLTFKASIEGLGLFLVALSVCLLVFSSAVYYAELGQPGSQIDSIPDAFWWAIITMTTVGYGDKVPVGYVGKLIGSACAITGVLTLAIPVPIITGHFNRFYAHKTGRGRHV